MRTGDWIFIGLVMGVMASSMIRRAGAQTPVDQEPDVPKQPGTCALYHTHTHGNGGVSFQLTCSAPVPDTVQLYPQRSIR